MTDYPYLMGATLPSKPIEQAEADASAMETPSSKWTIREFPGEHGTEYLVYRNRRLVKREYATEDAMRFVERSAAPEDTVFAEDPDGIRTRVTKRRGWRS